MWIARRGEEEAAGRALTRLVFAPADDATVRGVVTLDGISREPEPLALIAYTIDGAWEGRGLASEAVAAVVAHAFDALALRRLVAHYHPDNARSGALLARLGFTIEAALIDVPPALRALVRPQVTAVLTSRAWGARS